MDAGFGSWLIGMSLGGSALGGMLGIRGSAATTTSEYLAEYMTTMSSLIGLGLIEQ